MFLTPKQVAERLAVSTTAVYALCEAKKIGHQRIGAGTKRQAIRIPEEALAEYLERTAVLVDIDPPAIEQPQRRTVGAGYALLREAGWKG
jgi:excisionase family DNA binding protein